MKIKKYYDFIIEKSIGSEEIRVKHYDDLEKTKYYQIINIDPTSVRKKGFSKPGKYSKWLLHHYKIGLLSDSLLDDKKYTTALTEYLFVFSTNWYSSKYKSNVFVSGGELSHLMINDINKFSLSNFMSKMLSIRDEYLTETEDAKYDVIYSDGVLDVFVPLNFTASKKSAENTQWCSKSFSGYSNWNKMAILFRIVPKDGTMDKIKFTYKYNGDWFMAGPVYPELSGNGSPFENVDGKPRWKIMKDKLHSDSFEADQSKFDKIETTMNLLSDGAIDCILKYYEINKK